MFSTLQLLKIINSDLQSEVQRHRCNAILNLSECISVQFQADGEYGVNDAKLFYLSEIEIVTIYLYKAVFRLWLSH